MSEKISESPWLDLDAIKSDRTTFRLTEEAMKNLDWLQTEYALTPKELFELMCSKLVSVDETSKDENLEQELRKSHDESKSDKRKTYVLSKGTIKKLSEMADRLGISRNTMVSNMITIFRSMVYEGRQEDQKKRDEIRTLLPCLLSEAEVIHNKLSELGSSDPLYSDLKKLFSDMADLINRIDAR